VLVGSTWYDIGPQALNRELSQAETTGNRTHRFKALRGSVAFEYEVDLVRKVQINLSTGTERAVRRLDWEIRLHGGWKPFDPGMEFEGGPGEQLTYDCKGSRFVAQFSSKFRGHVSDVRGKTCPLRRIERYTDMSDWNTLKQYCKDTGVKLLRWRYLETRTLELHRCQDLPSDAFVDTDVLDESDSILVISHPWYSKIHPDPQSVKVRKIRQAVDRLHDIPFAVFIDYCCLPQRMYADDGSIRQERSLAEKEIFFGALDDMHVLYAHDLTEVLMLDDEIPTGVPSTTPYEERGWCRFEHSVARMKASNRLSGLKLSDGSAIPLVPSEFAKFIASAHFTNGSTDADLVSNLYLKVFMLRIPQTKTLKVIFGGGIPDIMEQAQCLASSFPFYTRLRQLTIAPFDPLSEELQNRAGLILNNTSQVRAWFSRFAIEQATLPWFNVLQSNELIQIHKKFWPKEWDHAIADIIEKFAPPSLQKLIIPFGSIGSHFFQLIEHSCCMAAVCREKGITLEFTNFPTCAQREQHEFPPSVIPIGFEPGDQAGSWKPPICLAAQNGQLACVCKFASAGHIESRGARGQTAIHWAAARGFSEIVKELASRGANVDVQDWSGNTPIAWAAPPGARMEKNTPEGEAAENDFWDIVMELARRGANLDVQGYLGYTPIMLARKRARIGEVLELERLGARS